MASVWKNLMKNVKFSKTNIFGKLFMNMAKFENHPPPPKTHFLHVITTPHPVQVQVARVQCEAGGWRAGG